MLLLILAALTFTLLFGGIIYHLSELKEKVHNDNETRKNIIWVLYISLSVVYMLFLQHVLSFYMPGRMKSFLAILLTTGIIIMVRQLRRTHTERSNSGS